MCEHFVARSAEPFRLDELWPFAAKLERYGIAGFGWGAGWIGGDGNLHSYRDVNAFRDDPGREQVGALQTTSALVHLRRPSKLSTLDLPDTQPFDDPGGRYIVSHNGDFKRHTAWRKRYREQGRIHGRADSEAGVRWLEDEYRSGQPAGQILGELHDTFAGQANLALLEADGAVHHYAGNTENPVFAFRLGGIGIVSTGLYSLDRSVFRFAAPGATERRLVPQRMTASLDRDGNLMDRA